MVILANCDSSPEGDVAHFHHFFHIKPVGLISIEIVIFGGTSQESDGYLSLL
jgi:hypothetical protein